ncbi:uncharacterized protein LOC130674138 [Microplitis mediator]|uniref:uncharacterized protein LOC130674138 n=1 Tax=Microplitis mediator TaxID=375433 RepID=UPI00255602DA|nr:uncharacterized protein LOC130674138 [Microplitis mediator]
MPDNERPLIRLDATLHDANTPPTQYDMAKDLYRELPNLDGEGPTCEQDFIELYAIVQSWLPCILPDHHNMFVAKIAKRISGRAKNIIEYTPIHSVEELLDALGERFRHGDPALIWHKRLAAASPKDGETIEDFYFRLRRMIKGLEAALPAENRDAIMSQQEKVAFDLLYSALPDLPKCLARLKNPRTLEELHKAIKEERTREYLRPPRKRDFNEFSRHPHKDRRDYDRDYNRRYSRDDYQRPRRDYDEYDDCRETRGRTFSYSKNNLRRSKYDTDDEDSVDFDASAESADYLTYAYTSSKGGRSKTRDDDSPPRTYKKSPSRRHNDQQYANHRNCDAHRL